MSEATWEPVKRTWDLSVVCKCGARRDLVCDDRLSEWRCDCGRGRVWLDGENGETLRHVDLLAITIWDRTP